MAQGIVPPQRIATPHQQSTEAYGAAILELCIEMGETITGEHGVGIEKINQLCSQFAPDELAAFHAVKKAFDEHTLLDPGNCQTWEEAPATFSVWRGQRTRWLKGWIQTRCS